MMHLHPKLNTLQGSALCIPKAMSYTYMQRCLTHTLHHAKLLPERPRSLLVAMAGTTGALHCIIADSADGALVCG